MPEPEAVSVAGLGWQEMVPASGLPFDLAPATPSAAPKPSSPSLLDQSVAQVFERFDWEGRTAEREIPPGITVETFFNQLRWDA
jgi:hypothetical protein